MKQVFFQFVIRLSMQVVLNQQNIETTENFQLFQIVEAPSSSVGVFPVRYRKTNL